MRIARWGFGAVTTAAACVLALGCSSTSHPPIETGSPGFEAGTTEPESDSGVSDSGGEPDSGDSGKSDSGAEPDSGGKADAGDAGITDAGPG